MRSLTYKLILLIILLCGASFYLTIGRDPEGYVVTALVGDAQVQHRVTVELAAPGPASVFESTPAGPARQMERASEWLALQVGSRVNSGDFIRTGPGSSLDLLPAGGAGIRVTPDTLLQLSTLEEDDLPILEAGLEQGKILLRIVTQKLHGKKKIPTGTELVRVKSPTATAGIRGTTFSVAHDLKRRLTTVAVSEGLVDVRSAEHPGDDTLVRAGSKAELTAASRFPPLHPLSPTEEAELAAMTSIKLELSLRGRTGLAGGAATALNPISPLYDRALVMITEYEIKVLRSAISVQAPLLWGDQVPSALQAVKLEKGGDYQDPWGHDYIYEIIDSKTALITSAGPDGHLHTGDDLRQLIEL